MVIAQKIFNALFRRGKRIDYGDGVYPSEHFSGLWEVCWPNGKVKYRCNFVDGKEDGTCHCFWDNGNLAQTGEMRAGRCVGEWVDFDYEGIRSLEGIFGEDGKEGVWLSFWSNGKIMFEREYKNGLQDGILRHHTVDGVIEYEGVFRSGEPYSGVCQIFTTERQHDGSYSIIAVYQDGKQLTILRHGIT